MVDEEVPLFSVESTIILITKPVTILGWRMLFLRGKWCVRYINRQHMNTRRDEREGDLRHKKGYEIRVFKQIKTHKY